MFIYLIGMKHFQNYEYHKHKRGIINLALAMITSMFFCLLVEYQDVINFIAKLIDDDKFKLDYKPEKRLLKFEFEET